MEYMSHKKKKYSSKKDHIQVKKKFFIHFTLHTPGNHRQTNKNSGLPLDFRFPEYYHKEEVQR